MSSQLIALDVQRYAPVVLALGLLPAAFGHRLDRGEGSRGEGGRHLANAHVAFNALGVLVALPLLGPAARLLERVLPDRPVRADATAGAAERAALAHS